MTHRFSQTTNTMPNHATIDRSGREIPLPEQRAAALPPPASLIELDLPRVHVSPLRDGRCQLVVDGVGVGYAARPELLAPVCRLLGGAAA